MFVHPSHKLKLHIFYVLGVNQVILLKVDSFTQVMIHGIKIEVRKGDITKETVQGIVNTTNSDLNLTGGGHIHPTTSHTQNHETHMS